MGEFAIKHPWITALLIIPTVAHAGVKLVVGVADAISNAARPKDDREHNKGAEKG